MQVEFRRHLVRDLGENAVQWFERERHKTRPIKNWDEVIESWKTKSGSYYNPIFPKKKSSKRL